jgi:4-hydroxybenzoyl-CoA thioesterase
MSKRFITKRTIAFGDCDPAQIVYYPRFYEMFDRNSEAMFRSRGLKWEELYEREGFLGMPLLDVHAKFRVRVRMGDEVEIHSWVDEFRGKTFVIRHELYRDGELCNECQEIRAYVVPDPSAPQGARAAPLPDDLRKLLEG